MTHGCNGKPGSGPWQARCDECLRPWRRSPGPYSDPVAPAQADALLVRRCPASGIKGPVQLMWAGLRPGALPRCSGPAPEESSNPCGRCRDGSGAERHAVLGRAGCRLCQFNVRLQIRMKSNDHITRVGSSPCILIYGSCDERAVVHPDQDHETEPTTVENRTNNGSMG